MKLLLAIALAFTAHSSQAQDFSTWRLADIKVGSKITIQLNDPILLQEFEHVWESSTLESGQFKCKIMINSHFDAEQAGASGLTAYTVTQNNSQNYLDPGRQWQRDQATLWMATENKSLPFIGLGCAREVTGLAGQGDLALTLGAVSALLEQPQFFTDPVMSQSPSHIVAEITPRIKTADLQEALHFTGVESGHSLTVTGPSFQNGRIVDGSKLDFSLPICRASYSPFGSLKPYDVVVPAGTEFDIINISGQEFGETRDGQMYMIDLEPKNRDFSRMTILCHSYNLYFKDFGEIYSQFRPIFRLSI